MRVKSILLRMTNDICSEDPNLAKFLEAIDTNVIGPFKCPRCDICSRIIFKYAGGLLVSLAESKYGPSTLSDEMMDSTPAFWNGYRSRVGVNQVTENHPIEKYSIYLGINVSTWEQFFYEVAHESLHLLGPVDTNIVDVAVLEEGVAVKFAEDFYSTYIKEQSDVAPYYSPISNPKSQYFKAYSITKKIPDEALKEVRKKFGDFHKVENPEFFQMVRDYVTESESDYLCSKIDSKNFK